MHKEVTSFIRNKIIKRNKKINFCNENKGKLYITVPIYMYDVLSYKNIELYVLEYDPGMVHLSFMLYDFLIPLHQLQTALKIITEKNNYVKVIDFLINKYTFGIPSFNGYNNIDDVLKISKHLSEKITIPISDTSVFKYRGYYRIVFKYAYLNACLIATIIPNEGSSMQFILSKATHINLYQYWKEYDKETKYYGIIY